MVRGCTTHRVALGAVRPRLRLNLDPNQVSYFVSRITLRCTRQPGMAIWRKRLFIALAHNAASHAEFIHLPEERTIVLSAEVAV
ncbi:KUP/HAK/KT family potassium transporter [Micromonospora cremea]|uniref:KUP/HAK/KT family potassium transporter n=1 Tax=Micromonospora cremea TaxID=709881 RepID=UPI003CC7E16A